MNVLDFTIVLPAFVAGLAVLSTHIPFGVQILNRGVIFADLAIAQFAALGVLVAELSGMGDTMMMQPIAASGALCGAAVLAWIERRMPDLQEAGIGLTFVLTASLGILLMSQDTHGGEQLKNLLAGQILWVSDLQVIAAIALAAALLLLWRLLGQRSGSFGFYALFALAVTASVQLVGIYLVFASLIVPALATHKIKQHRMLVAGLVGTSGYAAGLLVSVWVDLPAGPAIVWTLALSGILAMLRTFRI